MKIKKSLIMFFAVILSIIFVIPISAAFTDVPDDHPYKTEIDFCMNKGFVIGETPTTFNPDGVLTRADFAVVWCRSLQIKEVNHSFIDITRLQQYFDNPAIVLNSLGLFKGTSETTFSPLDMITREQLAVITMRTYKLGAANMDAYKRYADHESVSDWAREGISACLNAGVFIGLYDGQNLQPGKAVTRAEICKLIYNISKPSYSITIGSHEGGTITANPTKARAGATITLTVTPDPGMRLKAGTLRYNDVVIEGTTFTMPAKDVVITAEFEEKPVLQSIKVTKKPDKKNYDVGEPLDLSGMVVTATYSGEETLDVTERVITTPADGTELTGAGDIRITVTFTDDGITKTNKFSVTVAAPETTSEEAG